MVYNYEHNFESKLGLSSPKYEKCEEIDRKVRSFPFLFQGRCNRDKPPCKYFHPPQHLKDQLLINGRNHLALKNAVLQQVSERQPLAFEKFLKRIKI